MSPSATGNSAVDYLLGRDVDYITLAVPFFTLLIVIELVAAKLAGRDVYRLNDSVTDLSCGMIEQTLGAFLKTALLAGYVYVFNHYRLLEISTWSPAGKWAAAVALFFGVDLCFYWFHRFAHVMALPWATHVVHHSSEEMNLVVALRQSTFEDCLAWVFYLPLALIGFPPLWYVATFSFNLIWQFWCHTRMVDRLGPLEWFFNTPSHHRVHHARNPQYLDKNYAGTLIIWDRLFGTFEPEVEAPVYGITKPLASWNPFWANLHYWVELADLSRRAPYWLDKFKVWLMPLGWTPRGLEPERYARPLQPQDVVKYNARVPASLTWYVFVQFLLAMALSSLLMVLAEPHRHTPLVQLLPGTLALFACLAVLGGIFERRRWSLFAEFPRLILTAAGTAYWLRESSWVTWAWCGIALVLVGSLGWLWTQRGLFQNPAWVQVAPAGFKADLAAKPSAVDAPVATLC